VDSLKQEKAKAMRAKRWGQAQLPVKCEAAKLKKELNQA